MTKAWVFGQDISTDLIIPGKYMVETDPEALGEHAMEGADQDFADEVEKGDIIVAGKNFGCGSSREHAPIALKAAGIGGIVAESFARIFYRNAINQGVRVLSCEGIGGEFETGDEIEIDWEEGRIENLTREKLFETEPLPRLLEKIVKAGGIIEYLKDR